MGTMDFLRACKEGKLSEVEKCMGRKGGVRQLFHLRDSWGDGGLHWAAKKGRSLVVSYLLQEGWPIDPKGQDERTPLHQAAEGGYLSTCEMLIERGAKVNTRDSFGDAAIHRAAWGGSVEVVELLLQCGARLDDKGQGNWTPLHCAAYKHRHNVVQFLGSKGADPLIVGSNERSPLSIAEEAGDLHMAQTMKMLYQSYFLQASLEGRIDDVRDVMERRGCTAVLISLENQDGMSGLHLAAWGGRKGTVACLLSWGWPVDQRSTDGKTALHYAAQSGHYSTAEVLLSQGASVGSKDAYGDSSIHFASFGGHIETVSLLLRCGADIMDGGYRHRTPLHQAMIGGKLQLAEYLLENGADSMAKDAFGMTARQVGVERVHPQHIPDSFEVDGRRFLKYCKLGRHDRVMNLVQRAGGINTLVAETDKSGDSGLIVAAKGKWPSVVACLVGSGWPANQTSWEGQTALHCSAERGDLASCIALIECGADVNIKNRVGNVAIHLAVKAGDLDVVKRLLKSGAHVDIRGESDRTALHFAACYNELRVACHLLVEGSDPLIEDRRGNIPLDLAQDEEMHSLLLKASTETFLSDCEKGCLERVEELVQRRGIRWLLMEKDHSGDTALIIAAKHGYSKMVTFLLSTGWPVDQMSVDGQTALHCASLKGYISLCADLLGWGANLDLKNQDGYTALHIASVEGHLEIVKLLLRSGATVNITGEWGETPLHFAAYGGRLKVVIYLLHERADPLAKDSRGMTPLDMAQNPDICRYLRQWSERVKRQKEEAGEIQDEDIDDLEDEEEHFDVESMSSDSDEITKQLDYYSQYHPEIKFCDDESMSGI